MGELEPYDRRKYATALAANAASRPFNVFVLVATMAAATAVGGSVVVALLVALAVYAIACGRTFFDSEEADAVLARERARRRASLAQGGKWLDVTTLAPPIASHVLAAREREARIRSAIEQAELPFAEVSEEVDGFVRVLERTARRAQLLYEALADTPPERVAARLAEVERRGDPGQAELVEALRQQLGVQRRMEAQLARFFDELERIVIELDTVRGNLLSVSATTDAAAQRQLATEVRALREQMGAVAEGMAAAYEPS